MEQYIAQLGSGKPGELGTGNTERKIFKKIGIENPKIGFAPFHHLMHGHVNDWTLFQDLVQPLTNEKIMLFEFHKEDDMDSLKERIMDCDVFVLGSGVCEPYLEFIFDNKLNEVFDEYFASGKHFLGYSAGSICLTSHYLHVVFFREVFIHWSMVQKAGKKEREEFKKMVLHDCPKDHKKLLKELLESKENPDLMNHELVNEVFQVSNQKSLGLIPRMVMLPHYNEAIHATTQHMQAAAKRFPNHLHFGVPNGVCLLHTYKKGRYLNTEVVGKNRIPQLKVTQFFKKDQVEFKEGDHIDLS